MDLNKSSSSSEDMEEAIKKYAQRQVPKCVDSFWGIKPEEVEKVAEEDLNLTSRINNELNDLKQSVKFDQRLTVIQPKKDSIPEAIEEMKLDQIKIKGPQEYEVEAMENLIDTDVLSQDQESFHVSDGDDEDKHIPFHDDEEAKI